MASARKASKRAGSSTPRQMAKSAKKSPGKKTTASPQSTRSRKVRTKMRESETYSSDEASSEDEEETRVAVDESQEASESDSASQQSAESEVDKESTSGSDDEEAPSQEESAESDDDLLETKENESESEEEQGSPASEESDTAMAPEPRTVTVENDSQFFAATLQSLVMKKDSKQRDGSRVLAKRKKTPLMKLIDEQKQLVKKAKQDHKHKQETDDVGLHLPSIQTKDLERDLRKIATKGVVALFNAIRSHQHQQQKQADLEEAERLAKKSKDFTGKTPKESSESKTENDFISMLKSSSTKNTSKDDDVEQNDDSTEKKTSAWSVLRDDYMLGAKMKDYDREAVDSDDEGDDGAAAAAMDDEFSD